MHLSRRAAVLVATSCVVAVIAAFVLLTRDPNLSQDDLTREPLTFESFYYELREQLPSEAMTAEDLEYSPDRYWFQRLDLARQESEWTDEIFGQVTSHSVGRGPESWSYDAHDHGVRYYSERASVHGHRSPATYPGSVGPMLTSVQEFFDQAEYDGATSMRIVGREEMLGRPVAVVVVDPWEPFRVDSMGEPPQPHRLELRVDVERGFILRSDYYAAGELYSSHEITRIKYDPVLPEATFVFEVPAGATSSGEASALACIKARQPGMTECERSAPEGFLFPRYLPDEFLVQYSNARPSLQGFTEFLVTIQRPSNLLKSTHWLNIREFHKPGGFPDHTLTGREITLGNGRAVFVSTSPNGQITDIWWLDGELLITLSTSLAMTELVKVVESMQ